MDTDIITVPEGTFVECNRCCKRFPITKDNQRGRFKSQLVTRLRKFECCPHCHMNDNHWLTAASIAPSYEHLQPHLRKDALRLWAVNN